MALWEQTSRGAVWGSSHPPHFDFEARLEVRDIKEKGIVVILCQDGVAKQQGHKLLKRRWEELRLMDYIVDSPEFAAGDLKASFEAGFNKMDENVEELVDELDKSRIDWGHPMVWRARYNTVVVVVRGKKVFMAGGGGFIVRRVGEKDVVPISCRSSAVARAKFRIGLGYRDEEAKKFSQFAESKRTDEKLFFYEMYKPKKDCKCIVVEQLTPFSRTGGTFYLEHGKNWGSALNAIEEFYSPVSSVHFGAVLLALEPPARSTTDVASAPVA